MREADVAIRMKEPSQADLIRRRLMDVRMRLFAHPDYLAQHGTPKTVKDLSKHCLITQAFNSPQPAASAAWSRVLVEESEPRVITITSYFGVLQAAESGLGIGILPDYLQIEVPGLVPVMPDEQSESIPVFLAYPEELRHSKRVATFRDFVLEEISEYRRARREDT